MSDRPQKRFEVVNDGPRRWVVVDNESDDRICFVYPSEKVARQVVRNELRAATPQKDKR